MSAKMAEVRSMLKTPYGEHGGYYKELGGKA
jgi:hypothetical protein